MKEDKKYLGQVFTPKVIVEKMISLISFPDPELILETSSGSGNFYFPLIKKYSQVIALEIDQKVAHPGAQITSYFKTNYHPQVIIGNPPYVDYRDIQENVSSDVLVHKPNLYFYFLEKALKDLKKDGELIWIVPSAVFTTSSSRALNKTIFHDFSITYWEQVAESIWKKAAVPTAIIKIVKTKNHPEKIAYFYSQGKIFFGDKPFLGTEIIVKVGGASGFNASLQNGTLPFVVSYTERNQELKPILYEPHKWIRPTPKPPLKFSYQIFVNCKTRKTKPFYFLEKLPQGHFINYDAAVLCLYVTVNKTKTRQIIKKLNNFDWEGLGIKRDGRFHFSQSILSALFKDESSF